MSDGVVEARQPSGELFGFDRVHNLSNQSAFYIADAAKEFGQEDDITVLTVRRSGAGHGGIRAHLPFSSRDGDLASVNRPKGTTFRATGYLSTKPPRCTHKPRQARDDGYDLGRHTTVLQELLFGTFGWLKRLSSVRHYEEG